MQIPQQLKDVIIKEFPSGPPNVLTKEHAISINVSDLMSASPEFAHDLREVESLSSELSVAEDRLIKKYGVNSYRHVVNDRKFLEAGGQPVFHTQALTGRQLIKVLESATDLDAISILDSMGIKWIPAAE